MFETTEGWAWVKASADGYVGYVPASSLSREVSSPTHRIAVPWTFMYPAPDIKSAPEVALPLNARLEVIETGERFARLRNGRFVIATHLKPVSASEADFVAVAETFLHAPYLWGGKTAAGLDCSGLLQTALHAAGRACPRDTDMQERELGIALNDLGALRRGDLLFWKGHVGIMVDAVRLLHANGFHMQVVVEPADAAIARIAASGTAAWRRAPASVAASPVHHVVERPSALVVVDLPKHVAGDGERIRIGREVWRHVDVGHRPQRARRRQRLGLENVERGGVERSRFQAT